MRSKRIWVLIADARSARLWSTADGTSMFIPFPRKSGALDGDACCAWYRPNTPHAFLLSDAAYFAAHLAQILHEGAGEEAYDGLAVIAAPEIAAGLLRALTPKTSALLIGDVIRDVPQSPASQTEWPLELRH